MVGGSDGSGWKDALDAQGRSVAMVLDEVFPMALRAGLGLSDECTRNPTRAIRSTVCSNGFLSQIRVIALPSTHTQPS